MQPKEVTTCGAQGSPRPSQPISMVLAALLSPPHLQARPGQRPAAATECMTGNVPGLAMLPGGLRPSGAALGRGSSPAPAPVGFW